MTNAPQAKRGADGNASLDSLDGDTEHTAAPRKRHTRKIKRLASKELDDARRRASRKAGWLVERLNGGHERWVSPAGEIVVTSSTPSGSGVRMSLVSLRKAGLS